MLRILVAIFVPPLGVLMQEGLGRRFWINLVLTLLGWLPGVIHAVYVLTSTEQKAIGGTGPGSLRA